MTIKRSPWWRTFCTNSALGLAIIVTGFAKRGLPHTSDLQASIIYNLRCIKAMDLEIVQFRPLA